jgi:predicted DNA-binding transcriptional regulator AlpA
VDIVGAKEIAERLGIPENTVHMWRKRGVLPDPEGTVSGMPAWRWLTIRNWLQSRGDVSGLRRQVLTYLASVQGGETSAIRNAMAARGLIGQHVSIGQVWTTLNDLCEEGLLGRAMGIGWTITDKGKHAAKNVLSDETAVIRQRMVGHAEAPTRVGRPHSRHV